MNIISFGNASGNCFRVLVCTVWAVTFLAHVALAKPTNSHHPLPGEIAPFVMLQLRTGHGNVAWHSEHQLGKERLLYLLIPDRHDISKTAGLLPELPADVQGCLVFQHAPSKNFSVPSSWKVLLDNRQILSSYYAPNLSLLTAVVIDASGFIRLIQPVDSNDDWKRIKIVLGRKLTPILIGKKAPDFIIRDMNGVTRSLHQLRGKRHLLLTFFPKCFTFTCGMQLSSLRDSWKNLQSNHLEVWGVSVDEADGVRGQKAFAEYLHLPFPLLPDSGHQLCLLYGSVVSANQMSSRMSVLIDKNGVVRWIDKQIDPRHYGDDVLAKMNELRLY